MAKDMGIVRDRRCSAQHTGVSMKRARAWGLLNVSIYHPYRYAKILSYFILIT